MLFALEGARVLLVDQDASASAAEETREMIPTARPEAEIDVFEGDVTD